MWLLAPFRLIQRTASRFHGEHYVQTAAALSFATLIGLVPMIAAAFAVISFLPVGVGLGPALQKFLLANLLPDKAGIIVAKYIGQFASRAGQVTFFGVGAPVASESRAVQPSKATSTLAGTAAFRAL